MELKDLKAVLARRKVGILDAQSQYAVLVPLLRRADGLHLLYEVRAAALRRQPGEVCFPGGKLEPGEAPLECALRETWEELGLAREHIEVLAPLDVICGRGNFVMHSFLALVDTEAVDNCTLCPDEVESLFTVPLSALRAMPPLEYHYDLTPTVPADFPYELLGIGPDYPWRSGTESGPVYPWQGKSIWGLTGRISRHVLSLLPGEVDTP